MIRSVAYRHIALQTSMQQACGSEGVRVRDAVSMWASWGTRLSFERASTDLNAPERI